MKRLNHAILIAGSGALFIAIAGLWWLIGTTGGARWALEQATRLTPLQIRAAMVEGRLAGELRITGLHAAMPGVTLDAGQFVLKWRPLGVLNGRISVDELALEELRIRDDRPHVPGPPGFAWPRISSGLPPLLVRIRSLLFRSVLYERSGQPSIRIDSLQGDLLFSNGTVQIRDLTVRTPQFEASGSLRAGFFHPVLRADLLIVLGKPASGVDRLAVTADLESGMTPVLLDGPIGATLFSGSAKIAEFQTQLAVSTGSILMRNAVLTAPGRRGRITGHAEAQFGTGQPHLKAELAITGLDLSAEIPFITDVNGRISINGSRHWYEGSFVLEQQGKNWRAGKFAGDFRGTSISLTMISLRGDWLEGRISGSARMEWKDRISISASLKAREMNPARIAPAWPGTINAELNGSLRIEYDKEPRGKLKLRLLNSRVRGEALSGAALVSLEQGKIVVHNMSLQGTGFQAKASGDPARDLLFSARLADLSLLRHGAAGLASIKGHVRMQGGAFSGSVALRGRGLAMNDLKAASLDLRARIGDREGFPFDVKLSLRDGTYGRLRFDALNLETSGTLAEHGISLSIRSPAGVIAAELSGSWHTDNWQGAIVRFSGSDRQGLWTAAGPASLIISRTRFSLSPLVVTGKDGEHITLQGSGETTRLSGSFELVWKQLNIARLNTWFTGLTLQGFTNGRMSGKVLTGGLLDASGSAELAGGVISRRVRGLELKAEIRKADLAFLWRGERLEGTLSLVFAEQGRIRLHVQAPLPARLPIIPDRDGPLQGTLSGRVRETGLLSLLFPGMVQKTRGELELDLRLSGTWNAPDPQGSIRLRNAAAGFPAAGITVADIILDAALDGNRIRITTFSARSGTGSIRGKGTVFLDGWLPARYEGSIEGEQFQAVLLPQMRLQVSPKIEFQGTPRKLTARGEMRVPELLVYGPPAEGPVEPSDDVMIAGARKEETPARITLDLEIRVILGDRVIVKAAGVDASLGGEVVLTARSLSEMTGKGEIKVIRGKYGIYGVSLDIMRGRLFFAGGTIENPTLDILALKTIDEVKAGVLVSGTLQRPVVNLHSDPALPETDILAYIVLGHPLGQDQEQGALLMRAAAALLSAGESVALQDQIKNRLGLDTIDIQSDEGEVSRSLVTIGKYLSRRLYVSYGYALITGESLIRLRYRFGRHWELESRSGATSGLDLYYTIQFD